MKINIALKRKKVGLLGIYKKNTPTTKVKERLCRNREII